MLSTSDQPAVLTRRHATAGLAGLVVATRWMGPAHAAAPESRFHEVPNARIHYLEAGAGTPILFLHGIPSSSYLWRNVLPLVAAPDRHLLAPDLVGFGRSTGTGFDVLAQVSHLSTFIDALGLRRVVIVGHDWGAGIGLMWAARHPERVVGFASMEGAMPPAYPRPDLASFGPAAPLFRRFRDPVEGPKALMQENAFVETIVPASVVHPLPPEVMAAYRAPFPTPDSRRPIYDMVQSLPIGGEPAEVVKAYREADAWWRATEIPKLVLYATPGRLQPLKLAQWSQANLRSVEIAEVGPGIHFIQEDSPQGVAEALGGWLERITR